MREMGYQGRNGEFLNDAADDNWFAAAHRAWDAEVREKGWRLNLGDAIDRSLREITIAIGERWPDPEPKLTAAPKKRRAA
jgi:hypothetical protein